MPTPGDTIETRLISEQQGVQMSTTLYWEVDDLGNAPTIQQAMADLANKYVGAFRSQLSIQWAVTCVLYRNITNPAEAATPTFVTEAGSEVTVGPHPSTNVVRVTRYGIQNDLSKTRRSSIAITGLHKDVSKRGRVESDMELGTLEVFLSSDAIVPAAGWTLTPKIRYDVTPPPAPSRTYEFATVNQATTQGVFRKLSRRSSALCGTS